MLSLRSSVVLALAVASGVFAETHTVTMINKCVLCYPVGQIFKELMSDLCSCGSGTPTLVREGKVVSQGAPFTATDALPATIAFVYAFTFNDLLT